MGKTGGFVVILEHLRKRWGIILVAALGVLFLLVSGSLGNGGRVGASADPTSEIEELCASMNGVGECRVMLSYGDDGESVTAIVVLCEGGADATVRYRLTEMLCALYGIGSHRISVEKLR